MKETPEQRERRRIRQHEYYLKNKAAIQARTRAWAKAHPERLRAYERNWVANNRATRRETQRKWRMKNPDKIKEYDLRSRSPHHGFTRAEIFARLEQQGGRCAVCKTTVPGGYGWCGDHDHKTGAFRGVLCRKCNTGIGLLGDTATGCAAAAEYLRRHDQLQELL